MDDSRGRDRDFAIRDQNVSPFPNRELIPDSYFYLMTGAQSSSRTSTSPPPPIESEEMGTLGTLQIPNNPSYGSIGSRSRAGSGSISPKLNRVPEERPPTFVSLEDAEEEVEMDLEDQGYFVGEQPSLI